jgi:hypothetical protein
MLAMSTGRKVKASISRNRSIAIKTLAEATSKSRSTRSMDRQAHFRRMAEATAEDFAIIPSYDRKHIAGVPDRVLKTLENMAGHTFGFPVNRIAIATEGSRSST